MKCIKKLMHYVYSSITSQKIIIKFLNKYIYCICITILKSFYNFQK